MSFFKRVGPKTLLNWLIRWFPIVWSKLYRNIFFTKEVRPFWTFVLILEGKKMMIFWVKKYLKLSEKKKTGAPNTVFMMLRMIIKHLKKTVCQNILSKKTYGNRRHFQNLIFLMGFFDLILVTVEWNGEIRLNIILKS